MGKHLRTVYVLAGSVALALAAAILWWPDATPLLTPANAQEKARPADRPVRLLVEAGPARECATQFALFKGNVWGRRTTYSDNRVEYSVRFSVGNFATVLSAESVSDFVSFAKQVEEKRKDLQVQKPAKEAWIFWQTKDFEGSLRSYAVEWLVGVWVGPDLAHLAQSCAFCCQNCLGSLNCVTP